MRLDAPFLRAAPSQAVLAALDHRAFFVGGCVRNALLEEPVGDLDLSTPLRPEEVISRAEATGLKAVPTGLDHGTVTVVVDGVGFEVTTFRADVETDGRHAVVRFTEDLAEDAERRDFTMNALYAAHDGTIIDPLGGLPDLLARRVRFIMDPERRIREDALRILRFFRFTAWYADAVDAEGLAACAALGALVETLARERIGNEMRKLLAAPYPAIAVAAMAASGILARILPGSDPQFLAPLAACEATIGVAPDWPRRLIALGGEGVEDLRLSRAETRHLDAIRNCMEADLSPAASAAEYGADAARSAALIRAAAGPIDLRNLEADLARGASITFPLTAKDLVEAGISQGPALGAALKAARRFWLTSDLVADRAALLAQALAAAERP